MSRQTTGLPRALRRPLKLKLFPSLSVVVVVVVELFLLFVGTPVDFASRVVERVKAASRSYRKDMRMAEYLSVKMIIPQAIVCI